MAGSRKGTRKEVTRKRTGGMKGTAGMSDERAELYEYAVNWIAWNDEPEEEHAEQVESFTTVALLADTFQVPWRKVAEDVVKVRKDEGLNVDIRPLPGNRP